MIHNPPTSLPLDAPSGIKGQVFSRRSTTTAVVTLTSGRMTCAAIPIEAGTVISGLSLMSSTTALSGGSHFWMALYDPSLNLLGQSANDTSPVVGASAKKDVTLASPVTVTTSGLYLVGVMAVASTMPTLVGVTPGNASTTFITSTPGVGGNYNTGLTTTAPSTATFSSNGSLPWFGYS